MGTDERFFQYQDVLESYWPSHEWMAHLRWKARGGEADRDDDYVFEEKIDIWKCGVAYKVNQFKVLADLKNKDHLKVLFILCFFSSFFAFILFYSSFLVLTFSLSFVFFLFFSILDWCMVYMKILCGCKNCIKTSRSMKSEANVLPDLYLAYLKKRSDVSYH